MRLQAGFFTMCSMENNSNGNWARYINKRLHFKFSFWFKGPSTYALLIENLFRLAQFLSARHYLHFEWGFGFSYLKEDCLISFISSSIWLHPSKNVPNHYSLGGKLRILIRHIFWRVKKLSEIKPPLHHEFEHIEN